MFDLDDDLLQHLMGVSKKIGGALNLGFKPVKVAVMVAGLEVPHAHIHLVPMVGEHDLDVDNADLAPDPDALDAAADRIRATLRALGHEEVAETLSHLGDVLVEQAARLIRPGGQLVYSVCTLTVAETIAVDDQVRGTGLLEIDPSGMIVEQKTYGGISGDSGEGIDVTDAYQGVYGADLNTEIIQEQSVLTGAIPATGLTATGFAVGLRRK